MKRQKVLRIVLVLVGLITCPLLQHVYLSLAGIGAALPQITVALGAVHQRPTC